MKIRFKLFIQIKENTGYVRGNIYIRNVETRDTDYFAK